MHREPHAQPASDGSANRQADDLGNEIILVDEHQPDDFEDDDAESDAGTVQIELAAFSLTRDQAAERYQAAGIKIVPRTVSHLAKEGILRAHKVPGKNGLQRYLIDPASVDEDIARRQREEAMHRSPDTVHAPVEERINAGHTDDANTAHAAGEGHHLFDRERKIVRLETELEIERRERRKAERRAEEATQQSIKLSASLGQARQQVLDYQVKVAALEAPKAEPASTLQEESAPFLHRLFRWKR